MPYDLEQEPRRNALLLVHPSLSDHPLVRAAEAYGPTTLIPIPDRDSIAVLRFVAGVWPQAFESVPWEIADSAAQEDGELPLTEEVDPWEGHAEAGSVI